MRKFLLILGLLLGATLPAAAQTTNVTATVVDSASVPYSNGNYSITLVNTTGQIPYFQGAPLPQGQQQYTGKLNSAAAFTITLPSSNHISTGQGGPVSTTTWNFAITASDGGSGFNVSLAVTGTSQSLSSSISAAAPRLTYAAFNAIAPPVPVGGCMVASGLNQWSPTLSSGCPGAGGTPGGSSGQLQYNNSGAFGGTAGIAYSFPGSVPTLTFTQGSAVGSISPQVGIWSDGAGNSTTIDGASFTAIGSASQEVEIAGSPAGGAAPTYIASEGTAPGDPNAGFDAWYFDSTTHNFTCLRHDGTSCLPIGTGFSSGTTIANSIASTPANGFTLSDGSNTLIADPSNGLATTDTTPEFCELQGGQLFCANGTPGAPTNPGIQVQATQIIVKDVTGNTEANLQNNGTFGLGFSGAGGHSGSFTLNGATSGLAAVGAAAAAGTPCEILLPVTSPTVGQTLTAAACTGSPSATQTSWSGGAVVTGTLTMTTATTDTATVTGATASSHCWFSPTNSTAAASTTVAFVSSVSTNSVVIGHVATTASGGTLNVACTVN